MSETTRTKREDKHETEARSRRRLIGVLLLPIAFFPLLSLISYDWRDISMLNSPPLSPAANLIGPFGAWFAFIGYSVFGLAVWVLPVLVLAFSVFLLVGRVTRIGRRAAWMGLFICAFCGLFQLYSATAFDGILGSLNLRPNAGGAVGYWLTTCFLERWFSPFGGGVLMVCIMLLALLMAVGVRELFGVLGRFTGWWQRRREEQAAAEAAEAAASPDGLSERERARRQQADAREAARQAREEARRLRAEEKERARLAKEEERAEKAAKRAADKEAARLAREKAAEERDFEKQQQERERRLRELQAAARAERLARLAQASATEPQPRPPVPDSVPEVPPVADAVVPPKPAQTPSESAAQSETPPSAVDESVNPGDQEYPLPPIDLLDPIPGGTADHGDLQLTAQVIKDTLANFNVDVEIVGMRPGPVVTQYELKPGSRIKVERIVSLSANLQMALAAKSLRIEAPIPGKQAVGIEVPNRRSMPVTFHQILMGTEWQAGCEKMAIPLALGKDVAGNDLIYDLAKAPHLLVAGSTGSGKSVCLNAIITGLLMSRTPEELRLILVDPKRVEFTMYNDLPQLLVPVINDAKKVHFGLRWAIVEMNNRYKLLQKVKCRNIEAYNHRNDGSGDQPEVDPSGQQLLPGLKAYPEKLPYIVIIIDEVADIMASVGKEIEPAIAKLCALSRAVGIHLILATQRPSVDVITGTIKSNIPGRIAFKVSQANDSRTILDNPGAEELIGKGDMLFLKEGSTLMRAQGAYVSDDEIRRIVEFVKEHCKPCYDKGLCRKLDGIQEDEEEDILDNESEKPASGSEEASVGGIAAPGETDSEEEKNIQAAIEVIRMTNRASTSMLQRRLGFGYNKAARIMDALEERGIVGPSKGAGPREILKDLSKEIPDIEEIPGVEDEALADAPGDDGIPEPDAPPEAYGDMTEDEA